MVQTPSASASTPSFIEPIYTVAATVYSSLYALAEKIVHLAHVIFTSIGELVKIQWLSSRPNAGAAPLSITEQGSSRPDLSITIDPANPDHNLEPAEDPVQEEGPASRPATPYSAIEARIRPRAELIQEDKEYMLRVYDHPTNGRRNGSLYYGISPEHYLARLVICDLLKNPEPDLPYFIHNVEWYFDEVAALQREFAEFPPQQYAAALDRFIKNSEKNDHSTRRLDQCIDRAYNLAARLVNENEDFRDAAAAATVAIFLRM